MILFRVLPVRGTQFRAPVTIQARLLSGLVAPMRDGLGVTSSQNEDTAVHLHGFRASPLIGDMTDC
jgi:hypothetical protein